ncbi:MAG: nucleotidyltransferase substrate binding protein [Oligoflexia bacterium]|nr:nucleotidyltransferase substrate binding protein [Oligoflexia bacterium]
MSDMIFILEENYKKLHNSIQLTMHSINKLSAFDPSINYSADDLEPYDALVSRFERTVEIAINKFFRSVELYEFKISSDTIRDRLNKMEKIKLITSTELWLEMRDIRNRIPHDYLPEKIKQIYDLILEKFGDELKQLLENINKYFKKINLCVCLKKS